MTPVRRLLNVYGSHGAIADHLRAAERLLSADVRAQRRRWRYRVRSGRVWFHDEVRLAHRRVRQSIPEFLRHSSLRNALTAPLIYSLIVPFALLDAWTTLYQWTCFPLYGVTVVPRRPFFVLDRHKLGYLNAIEKANCAYCSYTNGVIAYVRDIAARTEQYWCPIKHARPVRGGHSRYAHFADYGDAAGYRDGLTALRQDLHSRRWRSVL